MRSYHLRRALVATIVGLSAVVIFAIWRGLIQIYDSTGHSESHMDAVVGGLVQTTSGVAAISLALIFLTAQLSASKSSVLRELYRGGDVYLLLAYVLATIITGYGLLVAIPGAAPSPSALKLIDTVLVLAVTTVLLIAPVLMLQLENLDSVTLAAKLADNIKPGAIIAYGLTDVRTTASGVIEYRLNIVGLRPKSVDPFRPIHEVLMTAVDARDRVLFGKLLRQLLRPIVRAYGAAWDAAGLQDAASLKPSVYRRLHATMFTPVERAHTALAILHYVVKRARNLRTEWKELDIGRHGTITALGDLLMALAPVAQSGLAIRLALFAARQTAEYYADIKPFGRIEPFVHYFKAANMLHRAGKPHEANLCVDVLAWVAVHTLQLGESRIPDPAKALDAVLHVRFEISAKRARDDTDWRPGTLENHDPWQGWLG